LPLAIPWPISELPIAPGIEAESPQEAHWRFRGLGAESPVFGAERQKGAKMTGKSTRGNSLPLLDQYQQGVYNY
jgi:hypothetical protein